MCDDVRSLQRSQASHAEADADMEYEVEGIQDDRNAHQGGHRDPCPFEPLVKLGWQAML